MLCKITRAVIKIHEKTERLESKARSKQWNRSELLRSPFSLLLLVIIY